jgi:hypothetical protein
MNLAASGTFRAGLCLWRMDGAPTGTDHPVFDERQL